MNNKESNQYRLARARLQLRYVLIDHAEDLEIEDAEQLEKIIDKLTKSIDGRQDNE